MFECKLKIQGESREDVGERIKKKNFKTSTRYFELI